MPSAYALGAPSARGVLRTEPKDFFVEETLPFVLDGAGEHLYLWVQKRDANTAWVAEQLASLAGIAPAGVSFAGLKDRHALTQQWFSLHLPGLDDPPWETWKTAEFQVLKGVRHGRKLRRGGLSGNRFRILVRSLSGADPGEIDARWQRLLHGGVPNYFGPQRFGRQGNNLNGALAMFQGRRVKRQSRSLFLSAARAHLFNQVLSSRIQAANWCEPLSGDVAMLEGSHSVFVMEQVDDTLRERLGRLDLHLSGPLWGRGEPMSRHQARQWEFDVVDRWPVFRDGLVSQGLAQERRSLRVVLQEPMLSQEGESLRLGFWLPAGSFATAVLRELLVDAAGELILPLPDGLSGA